MLNFNFYNPTNIIFGKDRLNELNSLIPVEAKVLLLYGGGSVEKFGTLQKVLKALEPRLVLKFCGIEPNPQFSTLMKAVQIVKENNIDFLLALGGGSVMDGTKFIAIATAFKDNPENILDYGFMPVPTSPTLPIGTIVTLPATGSEMNNGAVISHNGLKLPVFSNYTFPKFSILDPTLTFTLPATQVANGIVDTFVHVVEQYVTFPVDARFQDRTAEGILQTLVEIGRTTIANPTDYNSRANLMWCATMGLNGLIGAGVPQDWSAHLIGHELTALFGIDHAKTLAILLPAIWIVRKEKKKEKLAQYADRVWHIYNGTVDTKADIAITRTRAFFESLGLKTHLSDYGITPNDFNKIVQALQKNNRTKLSETKDLTLNIVIDILNVAL